MFYKYIQHQNNWFTAFIINTPDGDVYDESNRNIDGWEWHDNPPTEYLDWKEEQENKHITFN